MAIDDLNRRTFLLAGGAVVTGTLVGCGSGGFVPLADEPALPTPTTSSEDFSDDVLAGLQNARESDPTVAFLTRHDFDRWHGEAFDLRSVDGETVTVELFRVTDRSALVSPETRELGLREPFSVQFRGPGQDPLADDLYDVSHPDLGDVNVHVSYEGTPEDGDAPVEGDYSIYEIHFN